MDLAGYDLILVNTSGGKDSAVCSFMVSKMAEEQGVKDRIVLVHATFPEEWDGTVDIVKKQAEQLGLPLEVVERGEGLLDYVRRRGQWMSPNARYCTSDFKRAPIDKVITRLAPGSKERPAKVLNVMGLRAQESPARSKKKVFEVNERRTNSRRVVHNWLPILDMKIEEVWQIIRENNLPQHHAYALGMPRLSCRFCFYAPKAALFLAGKHNPELLREYVKVEEEIGQPFRKDPKKPEKSLWIREILAEVESGALVEAVSDWKM